MTFSASTATRGPSVGVARAAEAVATLALFVWIGGLIALGAFVAPQVFGQLDRERAGQLMGTIFRNFDGLVLACVALFALGESVRNAAGQWRLPWNRARAAVAVFIVGCGLAASAWYSPQIHQLFERGVRRGVGAEGARMETIHQRAETAGKGAAAGAVVWLLMGALSARTPLAKTRGSEAS